MARSALTLAGSAPLLAAIDRSAQEALANVGSRDHFYRVAGLAVRLRFAGPALVPDIDRAMAHLAIAPTPDPQLTIRIWDRQSTGTPLPWPGAEGRRVRGDFGGSGRGFFESGEGSLTAFDAERSEGWCWVSSPTEAGALDRAAPLSSIFRSWLAEREIHLVHSAGIGTQEACLLLVGSRGAGKSSTVLDCVASGLRCVGDDTCLIGPQQPPIVSSLYSTAQAEAATLEGLPFLEPGNIPEARPGKALAFFDQQAMLPAAPLRAIALAGVSGERGTRVRPASRAEALAAIAPTSILRTAVPGQATLTRLARVLDRAPCHHLEAGTDRDGVARAARTLL